jgi:hypothetical protein
MTGPTNLAEIGDKVGDRRGGLVMESVKRHDGLLPDALLGVPEQLHHLRQHRRNGLLVDEPAHSVERGAHHQIIVRLEVLLDGVDDEDDEVVVLVEKKRDGQVASPLEEEAVVVGHLDGVDVAKRRVVAEHLHVDEADDVLLHLALGDVGLGDAALEGLDLVEHDAVLLGLGSSLADRLHQVQELLGLPEPALGPHRQLATDRFQLLHYLRIPNYNL